MPILYGISQCKDHAYGVAAALSYWVFRCRDKSKSPAMGTKTWTYLESSIQNSAEISTCIEDFLQILSNKLIASLRPLNLPTRQNIRQWLLNPLEPPFTIAIAESGQKHVLPWAIAAQSKDYFPVQLELDCIYVNRPEFANLLACYEQLMGMEFSKSEIDSGDYRSDRLAKVVGDERFWELDESIKKYRGGLQLKLVSFVAQG